MEITRAHRDMSLNPGQRVRVVRTVSIAYDLDIADYLDGSGDTDISVMELESDIEDNVDFMDTLDEQSNLEITDIKVQITELH